MTPELIIAAVTAAQNLIEFILQAKANGQATDAQLDAAITTTNSTTRAAIAQALGLPPSA